MDSDRERIFRQASQALLEALPGVWAIYVYGSFARGDDWPDSDVDLGVLLPPDAAIPDKLKLAGDISRAIGRDVDVVELRGAGLDLVHEVLRDGKRLATPRPQDTLVWEAERLTDYAEFNPRRAQIMDVYLREPLRKVP